MLEIRPYQAEGLEFLTSRPNGRAALFDRPGLGKTMQSLLSMNDMVGDCARILVVAPGDATGVWRDEADKWLGEEAAVYAGAKASTKALGHQGVVVTNYHRMPAAFGVGGWHGVIFDESQMLRNRNTRTLFHYVRSAMPRHIPAFFLSGTPIVKNTGDVWPILHLINKTRWSSYWAFVKKYAIAWEDQYGWHVEGVTNLKGLWAETAEVVLRRTEGSVPLPPMQRQRIPLSMTPRQGKAYRELAKQMYTELDNGNLLLTQAVLDRETRLRQLLVCPRLVGIEDDGAALKALAAIAERDHEPFVVFTPFKQAIPFAREALRDRPAFAVHGGMGDRFHSTITAFKVSARDGEAPVLFSTVQMGKSWDVAGVTNRCYMLGFDWNNTTQQQAEFRLDRPGQQHPSFSYYFVHEGSHDLDALEVLAGKRRLADAILDHKIVRHRLW